MIIVIRHAQSEGNKNRDIHQTTPDHRVRLTEDGQAQAEEAGQRLRRMLKPDDTLHFFTSPYRRTRETTEGILKSLTSDDPAPSPFPRHSIKVWEEPRLREQDFGNFQPCSAEMERIWQERADYGHFFYRIPNGESAADAYDRVSGFNETLWRNFNEDDFASVCVLVTHGLMTRVFLMKWYHWSVEYFEDLRNVNHCEFIVMRRNDAGKYVLENELRTWSELKRQNALERGEQPIARSPYQRRKWGGCPEGCTHEQHQHQRRSAPNRPRRQTTKDPSIFAPLLNAVAPMLKIETPEPAAPTSVEATKLPPPVDRVEEESEAFPSPSRPAPGQSDLSGVGFAERLKEAQESRARPSFLEAGRDFGGSNSGTSTPANGFASLAGDGFDETPHAPPQGSSPGDYGFPVTKSPVLRGAGKRTSHLRTDSSQWGDATDEASDVSSMGEGARGCSKMGSRSGEGDEEELSSGETEAAELKEKLDQVQLAEQEKEDKSLRGSVY